MTTYAIRHTTTYRYRSPAAFGEHRLLLCPRDGFDQRTLSARFDVVPKPSRLDWAEDASGNMLGVASFGRRAKELSVASDVVVEVRPLDPDAIRLSAHARTCPFAYDAGAFPEIARLVARQHPDPDHALDAWVRAILDEDPGRDTLAFLRRLNGRIRSEFAYLRREEQGIQTPVATLRLGRGSCRDFAVLMSEAVRVLGFAARFVSGYLFVRPADEERSVARGSTHAWLQVFLPGAGWVDFDPTSGAIGNEGLVRTAIARDPADATPLSGSFYGFPHDALGMDVTVSVTRREPADAAPGELRLRQAC